MELPSTKPYLIRALHEWCCDNRFTPHIAVVVDQNTRVPREFVRDGQIVFNIDYEATAHLEISNEGITFQARFGGVARDISVPIGNVVAVYAKENGAGMTFERDSELEGDVPESRADELTDPEPPPAPPAGRAKLQRIK